MPTSAPRLAGARAAGRVARAVRWIDALYALGAVMLGVEAAVHLQQFVSLFHAVRWIGPLFLANAAVSLLAAAGLAHHRTRPVAALAGIAISACALGSLVLSYGTGLFGRMEGGWRTAIALALVSELGAVLTLAAGLAGAALRVEGFTRNVREAAVCPRGLRCEWLPWPESRAASR
jgi:O-antigen/teichoic acid export membrane protein